MKNLLQIATDKISAHLDTLQAGSPVTEQFISDHQTLIDDLRSAADTLLMEAHHAAEGQKILKANYDELLRKQDKSS
jgi:hypothetical protein